MRRAHAATGLADGRRIIPAGTRAHTDDLPSEPRDPYFHRRDGGGDPTSTFGSLSTTARRILAALRVTGADHLAGSGGIAQGARAQGGGTEQGVHGARSARRARGADGAHEGHGARDGGQPTAFGESTMCGDGTMDGFSTLSRECGELGEFGENTMLQAFAPELD